MSPEPLKTTKKIHLKKKRELSAIWTKALATCHSVTKIQFINDQRLFGLISVRICWQSTQRREKTIKTEKKNHHSIFSVQ